MIEATMSFTMAKAMVSQVAGPHYPAPITSVITIEEAARLSRDEALEIENKHFIKLAKTDVAQALVGIFLNDQMIKGKAKQAAKEGKTTSKGAVLGAGIMGGGNRLPVSTERCTSHDERYRRAFTGARDVRGSQTPQQTTGAWPNRRPENGQGIVGDSA